MRKVTIVVFAILGLVGCSTRSAVVGGTGAVGGIAVKATGGSAIQIAGGALLGAILGEWLYNKHEDQAVIDALEKLMPEHEKIISASIDKDFELLNVAATAADVAKKEEMDLVTHPGADDIPYKKAILAEAKSFNAYMAHRNTTLKMLHSASEQNYNIIDFNKRMMNLAAAENPVWHDCQRRLNPDNEYYRNSNAEAARTYNVNGRQKTE